MTEISLFWIRERERKCPSRHFSFDLCVWWFFSLSCFFSPFVVRSVGEANEWASLKGNQPDNPITNDLEDDDEQRLIHEASPFQRPTRTATVNAGPTSTILFPSNTLGDALRRFVDPTSSSHYLLIALALPALVVVFLATVHSSATSDPLTPGWQISHPKWDRTFTGLLLYLSTLLYFCIRYLFAGE